MENNGQTFPLNTSSVRPQSSTPSGISNTSQRSSIFSNLFQGRLNRRGWITGHIILYSILPLIATILLPVFLIILHVDFVVWIILILMIVTIIFFSISLSIRRLHDLDKNGLFIIAYFPVYLIFILRIGLLVYFMITGSGNETGLEYYIKKFSIGPPLSYLYSIYEYVIMTFGIYLLFWPGTKGDNKYGKPSTHWTWKEILDFTTPMPERTISTVDPAKFNKIIKFLLKIILGLIIFTVSLIIVVIGYGLFRRFFQT